VVAAELASVRAGRNEPAILAGTAKTANSPGALLITIAEPANPSHSDL